MTKRNKCGTVAGYQAHQRAKEPACEACKEARREYSRQWRKKVAEPRDRSNAEKRRLELVRGSGDHSPLVNPRDTGNDPRFLKEKGRKLWNETLAEYQLSPAALVILGETCRMIDRIERFAAALANRNTLWFELDLDSVEEEGIAVVVNSMIGEARQLTAAVRQNFKALGLLEVPKRVGQEMDPLEKLVAARQARLEERG